MATGLTKEQVKQFVKENNITDGNSLEDAFVARFKGLIQAILEEEMENELGYSRYDWKNKETDNSRNGHSKKTVRSRFGQMTLDVPRDTNGRRLQTALKGDRGACAVRGRPARRFLKCANLPRDAAESVFPKCM